MLQKVGKNIYATLERYFHFIFNKNKMFFIVLFEEFVLKLLSEVIENMS